MKYSSLVMYELLISIVFSLLFILLLPLKLLKLLLLFAVRMKIIFSRPIIVFLYYCFQYIYNSIHPSSQYQQTMIVASPLLGENNFMFSAPQCNNAP